MIQYFCILHLIFIKAKPVGFYKNDLIFLSPIIGNFNKYKLSIHLRIVNKLFMKTPPLTKSRALMGSSLHHKFMLL